jgi:dipeptidyl aminopeptidase/acylaminoacyl peptidase
MLTATQKRTAEAIVNIFETSEVRGNNQSCGVSSTRQLTFTKDKNETQPRWSRDGSFFLFSSNRDAAPAAAAGGTQLYVMRPDGGEARKITEARDGVSSYDLTKDGASELGGWYMGSEGWRATYSKERYIDDFADLAASPVVAADYENE